QDDVLPVVDAQAGGAGLVEDGAAGLPHQRAIAVLRTDLDCLTENDADLGRLVVCAPERCADRHRSELPAGVLGAEGLAGGTAVLLRETRVEDAAEVDVRCRAAGAKDNAAL